MEKKTLTHMCVFDWFKEFKEGHDDHRNNPKSSTDLKP